MKKSMFLMVAMLICVKCIQAQVNLDWVKSTFPQAISEVNDKHLIQKTDSGNLIIAGSYDPTPYNATFDPGVYFNKFDSAGNLIWAKNIHGSSSTQTTFLDLDIDPNGNIYVCGEFNNTVDFNPGNGVFNLTASGYSIFIAKYDPNGNFIWAKAINTGLSQSFNIISISIDKLGSIYATGTFRLTTNFGGISLTSISSSSDIFLAKLNSNGNCMWVRQIGGSKGDGAKAITFESNGNLLITGGFEGTVDFDPGVGVTTMTGDSFGLFISKFDTLGSFIWAKAIIAHSTYPPLPKVIKTDSRDNIYILGDFHGSLCMADFDPGLGVYNLGSSDGSIFISKFDAVGNYVWAKAMGNIDPAFSIDIDKDGNVYSTGYFSGAYKSPDFDPGPNSHILKALGSYDLYLSKLDSSGNFVYAKQFGDIGTDGGYSILLDTLGAFFLVGYTDGIPDYDFTEKTYTIQNTGYNYIYYFIAKYKERGVQGCVYNDINQNCFYDGNEMRLKKRRGILTPGNIIVETTDDGYWHIDSLPLGNYTIKYDLSGKWKAVCTDSINFSITNLNQLTIAPSFGLVSTQPCPAPDVSINMPRIRPCLWGQRLYVQACNLDNGTSPLYNAYVEIKLDTLISVPSLSIQKSSLGYNFYRINIDTLNPGQCVSFPINAIVSCKAILNQTICMQANLYPADSCVFDTIPAIPSPDFMPCTLPWDGSSISVNGWCQNDSIYFTVTNSGTPGNGDMDCYAPMRLFVDGKYMWLDSIRLAGGVTDTFVYSGDGRTWRLEVDQHPLHPGDSHPSATLELCGNRANWTPKLVVILPQDDADQIVDNYCGVVTNSYDPNDKIGYPLGVTSSHFIAPNKKIDYVINFQNTGTDTAINIVIRDTLDTDLDIFSVISGVSDHDYTFRIYGQRVLEWRLDNIMLPNASTNEPRSHGFVTFSVNQNKNLPDGTIINNKGNIYFDNNSPIVTNVTDHLINRGFLQTSSSVVKNIVAVDCSSYSFNGITYNQNGNYWQVIKGAGGIDTLLKIDVTIKSTKSNITASECNSYIAPDGTVFNTSGKKTAIIPNSQGCDSIITIYLSINASSSTITKSACETYTAPDGAVYNTSGTQTAIITNTKGCDSTITINLTITRTTDIDTTVLQNGSWLKANADSSTYQWIDCINNEPIDGATTRIYLADTKGSYAVQIMRNGCIATSHCLTVVESGIWDVSSYGNLLLYPNPANDKLILDISAMKNITNAEIEIHEITGKLAGIFSQKMLSNKVFEINISSLASGLYFLELKTGGKSIANAKIVKE